MYLVIHSSDWNGISATVLPCSAIATVIAVDLVIRCLYVS